LNLKLTEKQQNTVTLTMRSTDAFMEEVANNEKQLLKEKKKQLSVEQMREIINQSKQLEEYQSKHIGSFSRLSSCLFLNPKTTKITKRKDVDSILPTIALEDVPREIEKIPLSFRKSKTFGHSIQVSSRSSLLDLLFSSRSSLLFSSLFDLLFLIFSSLLFSSLLDQQKKKMSQTSPDRCFDPSLFSVSFNRPLLSPQIS